MKKVFIAAAASLVAIGLAIPSSAFASHFRSSYGSVSMSGSTLTWNVDEAWAKGDSDTFGAPNVMTVPFPVAGAEPVTPPNGGSSTAYSVTSAAPVYGDSNPLYSTTTESHSLDLSTITDDGTYELYASGCCRVDDVMNTGTDSFSQWIRFTKTGGTYDLPPNFNNPSLYLLIAPGVATSADFRATDPEGGAVTYTEITNTGSPYYGGETLACSSLVNGLLTLDPSLCAAGDVFSEIYLPGTFWTTKVQASDAQGNTSTVDTLFRVMTAPEPFIDDAEPTGNGLDYEFTPIAEDSIVDSWTITCTNDADATDIVTATSPTAPFTMGRFTNGASYSCDVDATNAAGTGSDTGYELGPVTLVGVDLALDLAVGANFEGASTVISGGGLQATSPYDLTMYSDPIVIDQGVTDANGNFTNTVNIPAEACLVGVHRLVLTGVDPDGNPVSDTQWVELGMNCDVLQLSRTEITPSFDPSLPDTGVVWATFIGVALLGGFLFLLAGGTFSTKGRLRMAGIDLQMKQKLEALNASLERMERQRRIRRNRK